jgi:hypothetical protein
VGTSAAIAVCLLTLGFNPTSDRTEEKVDLVELNHFHDDQGRPVFDQIIFYDWSPTEGRYQVRDWRLLKSPDQIPLWNSRDREFAAVWNDFKAHDTLRSTKAKMVRETWTQYDPELVEREFLAENKRRKLRDVGQKKSPTNPTPATAAAAPSTPGPLRPLQSPTPRPEG